MTDLTHLPHEVQESAVKLADHEQETLIGWKAITQPNAHDPYHVEPVRYMVITNKGLYEIMPDGVVVRAAVLHPFPTEKDL